MATLLVFKTNYCVMQVKRELSAILSTFIKLPYVIKTFVLSIFEWPFYTGFLVEYHINYITNLLKRSMVNEDYF